MNSTRRGVAVALALAGVCSISAAPLASGAQPAGAVTSTDFSVPSTVDGVTLKARFYRPAAPGKYPVVMVPHGGGGDLTSDAPRAEAYARIGYVGVVWSARGHGAPPYDSGGLFDFFGPLTVQDGRDVLSWVLSHPGTGADPAHVGITGYSQGGGTTNLVARSDTRIKAVAPGHTFSGLIESLKPNGCVKLSVDGVILGAAYLANKARPNPDLISRWSTFLATGQEIPNATTGMVPSQELEARSPRNFTSTETQPAYVIQAFDDPLFPVDQAVLMYHLLPSAHKHLYLSWGGHFQPQPPLYETTYREEQMHRWMNAWLKGADDGIAAAPPVTYWYLATDRKNIVRRETTSWPPPDVQLHTLPLSPGTAVNSGGAQGLGEDPAVRFGAAATGLGAVVAQLPHHTAADSIVTQTGQVARTTLYAGSAHADLRWVSTASPSQVIVKVWDVAPDGSATMLGRGCTMTQGPAGVEQRVQLDLWHSAVEIPAGHHFETWVQPADLPLWEPGAPATVMLNAGSTITLPLAGGELAAASPAIAPAAGSSRILPRTSAGGWHPRMVLLLAQVVVAALAVVATGLLLARRVMN